MASQNPNSARGSRLAPQTPRGLAMTPIRRAVSADPGSGHLSASARRITAAAVTPHARAAIQALDQRRAALFTPGRSRRRSRGEQRETPRDVLRNLSRVLAPASQPPASSSSSSPQEGESSILPTVAEEGLIEDSDDDFTIERPRFSLPLMEDDDDDDIELRPPRLSGLENENYTATSIELPRRAYSEALLGRQDRGSLGSVRFSDFPGPDVRSDDVGIDSGFFPPPAMDDTSGVVLDEVQDIERVENEMTRRETLGRESIFGPIEIPEAGNESTFMMAPLDSPTRDLTNVEDIIEEDVAEEATAGLQFDDQQVLDAISDVEEEVVEEVDQPLEEEELDETITTQTVEFMAKRGRRTKAGKKISKYGIEYPSLPQGVVKRLATTFSRTAGVGKSKISSDTLAAIMQASDWFFEQLGDDLEAYAKHAGRKTIDESDMITLMRRQRQTNNTATPFALAQRYLPRELVQEMRMPAPPPIKASRRRSRHGEIDEEEEVG